MRANFALIAGYLTAGILSVGCQPGAEVPQFAAVQAEVLVPSCGFSSCHGSGTGGLLLSGTPDDVSALVDVESSGSPGEILVIPGDAESSYLIKKLEGRDGIVGDPMPPGSLLDPMSVQLVRDWIDGGAL